MRKTAIAKAVVLAAAFGAMSSAMAVEVAANANITTDYKFRGVSQTNRGTAFQGGFDADFGNGFYLGNWNSNVNFAGTGPNVSSGSAGLETDLYGGYASSYNGINYDVGGLYYYYNKVEYGSTKLNTFELYGKLAYQNAYAKVSYAASQNYFGFSSAAGNGTPDLRGSIYYDLGYSYPVTDKFSLSAHYGHTAYDKDISNVASGVGTTKSYDDYSLTGAYTAGKYTFSLAYVDTNGKAEDLFGKYLTKGTLIATVGAKF